MKLTSFYAVAPVCTPSRAALMTGCYPKRVGLATGSWTGVLFPKDSHGLNPAEKTIARLLKEAGYTTGCFGKWDLGDQLEFLPTNHGFDTYFGIPYSNNMWPMHPHIRNWRVAPSPLPLIRNQQVVGVIKDMDDQAHLCQSFTNGAMSFIHKNQDQPFLLYLPHAFIHKPRNARQKFMRRADGDATRAQIKEVEWPAGKILDTIRHLGLAQDTLVIFTSDNGGSNEPLRGRKGST